jgi:hypothetical protein
LVIEVYGWVQFPAHRSRNLQLFVYVIRCRLKAQNEPATVSLGIVTAGVLAPSSQSEIIPVRSSNKSHTSRDYPRYARMVPIAAATAANAPLSMLSPVDIGNWWSCYRCP